MVAVFILLIFSFVWIIRAITNRGDRLTPVEKVQLISYKDSDDTVTKLVTKGRIVGNDEYGEVHITIGRDSRTLQIFRGYQGRVIASENFGNNPDAYRVFLSALHNAGFTNSRRVSDTILPEGVCPTGKRYWYEIVTGEDTPQSLWNTSCASVRGNFGGDSNTVRWLFENQIPGFDDLTEDVDL